MQTEADIIIDGLGGTSAVARMTEAPVSTVHSWRRNGIPKSRLAHLRLAAKVEGREWPGEADEDSALPTPASPGAAEECAGAEHDVPTDQEAA